MTEKIWSITGMLLTGFVVGVLVSVSVLDEFAKVEKNEKGYFCTFDNKQFRLVEL